MEELGSIWFYQEGIDELRQQLQYTSLELEALKAKANEQTRVHKEEMKNLLHLLKIACQERDEAKDQLQRFLRKHQQLTQPANCATEPKNMNPPLLVKANSSITESNSLSHGSSPVDSFLEPVSSPELSNINNLPDPNYQIGFGNQPFIQDCNRQQPFAQNCNISTAKIDPVDVLMDDFVKEKALPVKGRLLQTVMESGPLLQTLLVAGPLPRWRNPPPVQQSFRVPPVSMQKPPAISNSSEISRGYSNSQMCSTSMLSFRGCSVSNIVAPIKVSKRLRLL